MTVGDLYDILGINTDATEKDIKSAYRKAAKEFHADAPHNKGKTPEEIARLNEQFSEATRAYATLSDKEKRHEYDVFRTRMAAEPEQDTEEPFEQDISWDGTPFEDIFTGATGGTGGDGPRWPDLEEIYDWMRGENDLPKDRYKLSLAQQLGTGLESAKSFMITFGSQFGKIVGYAGKFPFDMPYSIAELTPNTSTPAPQHLDTQPVREVEVNGRTRYIGPHIIRNSRGQDVTQLTEVAWYNLGTLRVRGDTAGDAGYVSGSIAGVVAVGGAAAYTALNPEIFSMFTEHPVAASIALGVLGTTNTLSALRLAGHFRNRRRVDHRVEDIGREPLEDLAAGADTTPA